MLIITVRRVTNALPKHQILSPEYSNIVNELKQGGSRALEQVYVRYRVEFVQWLQGRFGCEAELAKDIYQQTILTFYENVQSGKLTTLTSQVKTYLFSIGRNKYYEAVREKAKQERAKDWQVEHDSTSESLLQLVEACLEKLGEPCRGLLMQFYFHKRSMEQLTELFDYKNIDTAKNQKYKCLERLRKLVKSNGQLTADNG